jgi:hypothetical protein
MNNDEWSEWWDSLLDDDGFIDVNNPEFIEWYKGWEMRLRPNFTIPTETIEAAGLTINYDLSRIVRYNC